MATMLVLMRAASLGSPWLAVIANALGALLWPLLIPALGTATYNMAKSSPCPFRFHLATEGGWDIGCFAGCLVAAALSASGAPLAIGILLALPGGAAGMLLLWRYYSRRWRRRHPESAATGGALWPAHDRWNTPPRRSFL